MKICVKETKIICSNPDNPYNGYFAWPTVARLHNGKLAMVASGFRRRHVCPFGKVVMCQSDDEGKTWTRPMIIMDTPLDDRDAGIVPFGEGGVIVTSVNNSKEFQTERNTNQNPYINGYLEHLDEKTAEEKYLGSTFVISYDNAKSFGKIMRIPVTTSHGPALMRDGSFLYIGRMFSHNDSIQENEALYVYKLYTDGTYERLCQLENVSPELLSCEPHAIVLENGKIIVHIRVQQEGYFSIFQAESYDDGKSFTKPHRIIDKNGGAPAHIIQLKNGTLISTYGHREAPFGIKMMYSCDGGESWSYDHDIFTRGVSWDMGYPASVELENGDILTVFYAKTQENSPAVIMQSIWSLEKE